MESVSTVLTVLTPCHSNWIICRYQLVLNWWSIEAAECTRISTLPCTAHVNKTLIAIESLIYGSFSSVQYTPHSTLEYSRPRHSVLLWHAPLFFVITVLSPYCRSQQELDPCSSWIIKKECCIVMQCLHLHTGSLLPTCRPVSTPIFSAPNPSHHTNTWDCS